MIQTCTEEPLEIQDAKKVRTEQSNIGVDRDEDAFSFKLIGGLSCCKSVFSVQCFGRDIYPGLGIQLSSNELANVCFGSRRCATSSTTNN